MWLEQHFQQEAEDQNTAQSGHCGACSKASTNPRSLGPAAKLGSTPRKVNETPLKCNDLMLCCMLSGLPALLLIAGVYPTYNQWSTELQHFCEAGQGSLRLKEAETAICGQGLSWLQSLTATHTFSYLINPFLWCSSQHQLLPSQRREEELGFVEDFKTWVVTRAFYVVSDRTWWKIILVRKKGRSHCVSGMLNINLWWFWLCSISSPCLLPLKF